MSQLLLAIASSNLVGSKSKCYFIVKFSLLLSVRLCWREIRPDTGKTIKNEFVASFLWNDYSEKRIWTKRIRVGGGGTFEIQMYVFTVPSPRNRRKVVGIESVEHLPYQSM